MKKLLEKEYELKDLNDLVKKIVKKNNNGDIFLLRGELGAGKTTFARLLINLLFDKYNIDRPKNIKSPSYPLMINYSLLNFEIDHYDLYRINSIDELYEIDFFENIKKNISIIEWPEIIIKNFIFNKYYLIDFKLINKDKRIIKIKYFDNKDKQLWKIL